MVVHSKFIMENETKIINCQHVLFVHHRIASVVKRGELVSYRISYIILRGPWFNIIVLNVLARREEKSDDSKDSFYEELEQVLLSFC